MITAMILAGGVGSRVGAGIPKQFVKIFDKPILAFTIEIYENHPDVDNIEIVCHASWISYCEELIKKYDYKKVKWITEGGSTFQKSVINGMNYLKNKIEMDDYVLVHYGASPFTGDDIVTDVIKVMKEHNCSVSATPCFQLLGSNDGKESNIWVDRDKFIQIACPYGFKFSYLVNVYDRAEKLNLLKKIEPHTTSLIYALG